MRQLALSQGNFFENFFIGQIFQHGVPRTITEADASLYLALTGSRFAINCASTVSLHCGFQAIPLDNFLVFHIAFGKSVNDISLNAVANLGYAEVQFETICFAQDTLSVSSEVIGLKQNSNGKNGIVYVRSIALNQHQQVVVSWIRWVMVENKSLTDQFPEAVIPQYQTQLDSALIHLPKNAIFKDWQLHWSDNQLCFDDLQLGDQIFHQDGITINQSEHSLATRLYQNNAKVHFNQQLMQTTKNQQRLVYGGHIISLCRAISYNGLSNAILPVAINAGTHVNPSFAGDTIYAQSDILDRQTVEDRNDVGLVRIRLIGIKNNQPDKMEFLSQQLDTHIKYHQDVVLDLDYWVLMLK